jgi:hypothetical protein
MATPGLLEASARPQQSAEEAALCACNICGGTDFGHGPSRRLSVSGRLPHCLRCSSLERHRIAHRIVAALAPFHTNGKKLLQFSPDPAITPSWFEEMVVSVWGGDNSVDMQNIALPAGRYDWVYSSHVLNHVPDPSAALREMLRLVGSKGVVLLSVGGTVTKYENASSERMFGPDRQYVVYGSQFADDILAVLPQVAVLELIAVDASTGSIDSLYLYSQDEQNLHAMARRAAAQNIHGRVFTLRDAPRSDAERASHLLSAPLSPCNICGGRAFDVGPNGRTAANNRLPLCEGCFSLERHRIAQQILRTLKLELSGRRLLQFDRHLRADDLGVAESTLVAVGTDPDLNPMALDVPAARFDWLYSSHLLNNVVDCKAALREMFRVVGSGIVVASVGRRTLPAGELSGGASAPRVFSENFADEVRAMVTDARVIEVSAADPSTGTSDVLYFCSTDERALAHVAGVLASQGMAVVRQPFTAPINVQHRPKGIKPEGGSVIDRLWQELQDELHSWGSLDVGPTFWLRDDDAGPCPPSLVSLVRLCEQEAVPLALAAIPTRIQPDLVELVRGSSHLTVLPHGFDHRNHSSIKQASEFPVQRDLSQARRQIADGWTILQRAFGQIARPIFVPPWGTCSLEVRRLLPELGIIGFSGSPVGAFQPDQLWRRGSPRNAEGLLVANAQVAVNRRSADASSLFPAARILAFMTRLVRSIRTQGDDRGEPIGIMTHDWGVDAEVEDFMKRLFETTRRANAQWITAAQAFGLD